MLEKYKQRTRQSLTVPAAVTYLQFQIQVCVSVYRAFRGVFEELPEPNRACLVGVW